MNYTVRNHEFVEDDLAAIFGLLADYSGEDVADRIVSGIAARAQDLSDMPHIGTLRDEILPGLRAVPYEKKAVIAFLVDDHRGVVTVLAITYGGADWQARVRERG